MLKRMASKFSHLKLVKDENPSPMPLPVGIASPPSSALSRLSNTPIYDIRGSISTDRTSGSQEDVEGTNQTRRVRLPQRPKGTYCLSDFIIQRTLGTGSFGRVHLGMISIIRV